MGRVARDVTDNANRPPVSYRRCRIGHMFKREEGPLCPVCTKKKRAFLSETTQKNRFLPAGSKVRVSERKGAYRAFKGTLEEDTETLGGGEHVVRDTRGRRSRVEAHDIFATHGHAKKKSTRRKNPVAGNGVVIYDRILGIDAQKGPQSQFKNEKFHHPFKAKDARILGLPDGSLLVKSKSGKRLWKEFDYPEKNPPKRKSRRR